MTSAVVHFLLLAIPGLIPACAIVQRWWAPVVSPIVSATLVGVGATIHLVVPLTTTAACVTVILLGNVFGGLSLWKIRQFSDFKENPKFAAARTAVLALAAIPLLSVRSGAYAWDYRSIWLIHAKLLRGPGPLLREAFRSVTVAFAHLDYPPLGPAAMVWAFRGTTKSFAESGQLTITTLNCAALAALGMALFDLSCVASTAIKSSFCAGLVVWLFIENAGEQLSTGLVDALWALLLAAGIVTLFGAPHPTVNRNTLLAGLYFGASSLTKNEGLAITFATTVLLVLLSRPRASWKLFVCFVPALTWAMAARQLGAESDYDAGSLLAAMSKPSSFVSNLRLTVLSAGPRVSAATIFCGVCAIAAARTSSQQDQSLSKARRAIVICLGVASLVLLVPYLSGRFELSWLLRTSIDRTTVILRALLLTLGGTYLIGAEFRRRSALTAGAALALVAAVVVPSHWRRATAISDSVATATQFACIEQSLLSRVPVGSTLFVRVEDALWQQRYIEFAIGSRELAPEFSKADYVATSNPVGCEAGVVSNNSGVPHR